VYVLPPVLALKQIQKKHDSLEIQLSQSTTVLSAKQIIILI
jgi:hypothetical protein